MPDRIGQLVATSMLAGAGYGAYIKSPMSWVGQGIVYGLVSCVGANATSKNPENVYLQLTLSSMYVYSTAQELHARPKFTPLFAPLIGIAFVVGDEEFIPKTVFPKYSYTVSHLPAQ